MERAWTITELAAEAAEALAEDGPAVSGRVRELPNERLIRWYSTIGLVDPPLSRRGRTALYGRRHLLQLLAIKRRQAAGRSIAEIQVELAGATDDVLRSAALLDSESEPVSAAPMDVAWPGEGGREGAEAQPARFWSRAPKAADASSSDPDAGVGSAVRGGPESVDGPPAEVDVPRPGEGGADRGVVRPAHRSPERVDVSPGSSAPPGGMAVRSEDAEAAPGDQGSVASLVHGVRLAPGVTVLLDGGTPLGAEEIAAIRRAAGPLLDELSRLGRHTPSGRPT